MRIFGATEAVFLSTRLVEDRFGLAFEFFINVAHNFVEAAGVPDSFSRPRLVAGRGPGARRNQSGRMGDPPPRTGVARRPEGTSTSAPATAFYESAFSDSLAIYMLSLAVDFDYHDLREREYPLLRRPALSPSASAMSPPLPAQPRLRLPDPLPPQRLSRFHLISPLSQRMIKCKLPSTR